MGLMTRKVHCFLYDICCRVAAVRKEYARRSHEASEEWKQRMHRAESTLEENDQTYRAVGAGLSNSLSHSDSSSRPVNLRC